MRDTEFKVSISDVDKANGSPKRGDMIARNPKNHADVWLVAEQYFKDNFEAIDTVVAEVEKPLQSDEQIEAYALENILANDSVVAFREMSQWITGATWMRNKMRG